jgi:hypothetical protein
MNKITNNNPLLNGDPEKIAELVLSLLPKSMLTVAEQEAMGLRQREAHARYLEERHCVLPDDTYRLLAQGGITGWHHELEIDGELVVLPDDVTGTTDVHERRAVELAREEIGRRHGQGAAEKACFKIMWGGSL